MYVHVGWPYNHSCASRTWSGLASYAEALSTLGYNTTIIWPALETMPDPLTPSDRTHIEKTATVIDLLHREFEFRVYISSARCRAGSNNLKMQPSGSQFTLSIRCRAGRI